MSSIRRSTESDTRRCFPRARQFVELTRCTYDDRRSRIGTFWLNRDEAAMVYRNKYGSTTITLRNSTFLTRDSVVQTPNTICVLETVDEVMEALNV